MSSYNRYFSLKDPGACDKCGVGQLVTVMKSGDVVCLEEAECGSRRETAISEGRDVAI